MWTLEGVSCIGLLHFFGNQSKREVITRSTERDLKFYFAYSDAKRAVLLWISDLLAEIKSQMFKSALTLLRSCFDLHDCSNLNRQLRSYWIPAKPSL